MGSHVFISYSKADEKIMYEVERHLSNSGIATWVDKNRLKPGITISWPKDIEKGIRKSNAFIVILTPNANQSDFVHKEIQYAQLHDKAIYPVLAQGSDRDSLPIILVDAQYIDIRGDLKTKIRELINLLIKNQNSPEDNNEPLFQREIEKWSTKQGWQTIPLKELASIQMPKSYKLELDKNGEYPVHSVSGRIEYSNEYDFDGTYLLIPRFMLVDEDNLFDTRIVEGKFSIKHGLIGLTFHRIDILHYVKAYLEHQRIKPFTITSGLQSYVRLTALEEFPIPIPKADKQIKHVISQFEELERTKSLAQYQLKLIDELGASLRHRYFDIK